MYLIITRKQNEASLHYRRFATQQIARDYMLNLQGYESVDLYYDNEETATLEWLDAIGAGG